MNVQNCKYIIMCSIHFSPRLEISNANALYYFCCNDTFSIRVNVIIEIWRQRRWKLDCHLRTTYCVCNEALQRTVLHFVYQDSLRGYTSVTLSKKLIFFFGLFDSLHFFKNILWKFQSRICNIFWMAVFQRGSAC